jgi:hypothetical protein
MKPTLRWKRKNEMEPTIKISYDPEPQNSFSDSTPPPIPPYLEPEPNDKRGRWLLIGILGFVGLGIICVLSIGVFFLSKIAEHKDAPTATVLPSNTPTAITFQATNTRPRLPTQKSPDANATQFSDDFSNSNSGWWVGSTDEVEASYYQGHSYVMGVKQPNYYLVVTSPDLFADPVRNVIINVRGKQADGDTGEFGVVCRYQDSDNFYLAGITGDSFYIGKLVYGEWVFLTDPGKQPLPSNMPDQDGFLTIGLSCNDSFIVLEINGIGAAHVTDDEFSTGDAGLCVWSGDQPGQEGYYAQAFFEDFSASLP